MAGHHRSERADLTVCGIFGFTGPPDPARLAALRVALRHRGPDGYGEMAGEAASLGCNRLAIIDRAGGAQPLASEDGRLHLVCNGEIYNHRRLRRELEARGHRFATGSDVEVAIHAFEEEGEASLARLHGMFALALWDAARRRLLLARDGAGMKSLVYTRHEGRWWFASEAKALLLALALPRRLDPAALEDLLRLGFVPGPRTLFAGIARLPAGHRLVIDSGGGHRLEPFGGPPAVPAAPAARRAAGGGTSAELAAELRGRLGDAVSRHLEAEVPVGASLSGGLDSSFLVGLMAERAGPGVKTFAIGCPGDQDERPFARRIAERFRTEHHEIAVAPEDLWPRLPRVIWNAEEPRTGPLVLNDLLFERAARDVGVLLVGEGADELFGGYLRFKTALPPFGLLPRRIAAALYGTRKLGGAAAARDRAPMGSEASPPAGMAAERAAGAGLDGFAAHLAPAFAQRGSRRLAALLDFERRVQLPSAHLPRVDLLSMAHALEARLPYLDPAVIELAERVPLSLKVGFRGEKHVLREAARGLLPAEILRRRKQGQANPFRLWQAAGLLDQAATLLAPAAVRARGLFAPRAVERLLSRLGRGRALPFDHNRLHLLVLIELWQRVFLDPERLAPPAGVAGIEEPGPDGRLAAPAPAAGAAR